MEGSLVKVNGSLSWDLAYPKVLEMCWLCSTPSPISVLGHLPGIQLYEWLNMFQILKSKYEKFWQPQCFGRSWNFLSFSCLFSAKLGRATVPPRRIKQQCLHTTLGAGKVLGFVWFLQSFVLKIRVSPLPSAQLWGNETMGLMEFKPVPWIWSSETLGHLPRGQKHLVSWLWG